MSADNGENGQSNGEHGVTRTRVSMVTLTYDHDTCLVSINAHGSQLGLAQMMIDEAARALDIQRRQAAALEFQQKLADAKRTAALVHGLNLKG